MHIRNTPDSPSKIIHDTTLNSSTTQSKCYAVYSLGDWYLEESFIRLQEYLKSITSEFSVLYSVNPKGNEGKLHHTLLQYIAFGSSFDEISIETSNNVCNDIMKSDSFYTTILFKGLVFTKTGIALRGFAREPSDYEKLMNIRDKIERTLKTNNLPCNIPYKNDILHSTILRWKYQPTQDVLNVLNSSINNWKECVFGEIRISKWTIGQATWTMLDNHRRDIYTIYSHRRILHRGISISDSLSENHPLTIKHRNDNGYSCEYDIWFFNDTWWLGHDKPTYNVVCIDTFIRQSADNLIHAKDGATFAEIIKYCRERGYNNEIFYHTNEDYVLTSNMNIITYPGRYIVCSSICMMPENAGREYSIDEHNNTTTICSDLIDIAS